MSLPIISGMSGVYTPRSHPGKIDVDTMPSQLVPLPPPPPTIRPAAPAAEYHSDSAESLQEIPVSQTRMGSLYGGATQARIDSESLSPHSKEGSARNGHIRSKQTDSNGNISKKDGIKKTHRKRHKQRREPETEPLPKEWEQSEMNFRQQEPLKVHEDGRRKRHQDVPPLDLGNLRGNSDNDEDNGDDDDDIVATVSSKKSRQDSRVSQI